MSTQLSEEPNDEPNVPLITYAELSKHRSKDSCWILVNAKAYDVTAFLDDHPVPQGGLVVDQHRERRRVNLRLRGRLLGG